MDGASGWVLPDGSPARRAATSWRVYRSRQDWLLGPRDARHAVLLEAGWVFLRYVEVAFHGQAYACDGAFVEETADESDAVRDAAWWREFW
jgi:hypothetical protein